MSLSLNGVSEPQLDVTPRTYYNEAEVSKLPTKQPSPLYISARFNRQNTKQGYSRQRQRAMIEATGVFREKTDCLLR